MKTAIYVRSAVKNNESLTDQESVIRKSLGKREKVYKVYKDTGCSGINSNRRGLIQLLSDAQNGKFQSVCVSDLQRLSRSLTDCALLLNTLNKLGIVVKSKGIDLSSSIGRLHSNILMTFAEFDRDVRSERIKRGMLKRRGKKERA